MATEPWPREALRIVPTLDRNGFTDIFEEDAVVQFLAAATALVVAHGLQGSLEGQRGLERIGS